MKSYLLLMVFIASCCFARAQNEVKVSINGANLKLDPQRDFYTTPLSFIFDFAFKDKTIAIKADQDVLVNEKFGANELGKTIDRDQPYFKIEVLAGPKIKIGNTTKDVKSNKINIKIDGLNAFDIGLQNGDDTGTKLPPEPEVLGTVIYDALALKKAISKSDGATIKNLLAAYQITSQDELDGNFFLKTLPSFVKIQEFVINQQRTGGIQGNKTSSGVSAALASIGGLDVTTIANGFAKFIVKRTKQELTIAFFQKFRDHLASDDCRDLRVLFPHTYALLIVIDDQVYNYSAYINNLREAFRADLLALDEDLPGVIDNHKDIFSQKDYFELGAAIKTGCYVSSSLRHNMHPGDILDTYPVSYLVDGVPEPDKNKMMAIKGAIQALQLFSESMKEVGNNSDRYWVSQDKVRRIVNDQATFKIYIGLALQLAKNKYDGVKFYDNASVYSILNSQNAIDKFNDNYQPLKSYILTLGSKANELNDLVKRVDKSASDSVKVELYAKYFKATSQFLEFATSIADVPILKNIASVAKVREESKKYFQVAEETSDLAVSINRKNYSEVITHAEVIYDIIVNKPILTIAAAPRSLSTSIRKTLSDKVMSAANDVTVGTIKTELFSENQVVVTSSKTTLALFAKYGAFMASVIDAKKSDEVARAIEAAALPVGSASIKRLSAFNVSLNAYAGIFAGNEVIKGLDNDVFLGNFKSYGITAPIGFSINWGNRILPWPVGQLFFNNWKPKGWSSSYFISVVDIGVIAAYRFTNDGADAVPSISLKDIVSPGIFWSLGIPKTPISFNIGAQIGPNLRKVTGTANDYSNATYSRYSLSLCVDIPLANLYNK